jgi:hypothetical protein
MHSERLIAPGSLIGTRARKPRTKEQREALLTEDTVEQYLRKRVRALGGKTKKLTAIDEAGWPDRLVLWPGAVAHFVETKRPKGGRYEPMQLRVHARLRALGFGVHVLRTKALVDNYVGTCAPHAR